MATVHSTADRKVDSATSSFSFVVMLCVSALRGYVLNCVYTPPYVSGFLFGRRRRFRLFACSDYFFASLRSSFVMIEIDAEYGVCYSTLCTRHGMFCEPFCSARWIDSKDIDGNYYCYLSVYEVWLMTFRHRWVTDQFSAVNKLNK